MCVCIYIYIYTYTCIHVYIHVYTGQPGAAQSRKGPRRTVKATWQPGNILARIGVEKGLGRGWLLRVDMHRVCISICVYQYIYMYVCM